MLLNRENYRSGFLVDDEVIGGVTEMDGGLFAAYVSHYLTGETYAYQEFATLEPALEFLTNFPGKGARNWAFEAVGCKTHTASSASSSCGACSCSK